MQLVFASSNHNKIREINEILPATFNVIGLKDIGITEEIPEPGATIKENSFLKASYVANFLKNKGSVNTAVFADDSGLEVEALGKAPGVHSARYAGIPRSDENNNLKLLKELQQVTLRQARFVCVITLILGDRIHYFEGEMKGTIAYEPRGEKGFGYDPLFIPQGYRSTFAELEAATKNEISHRGKAVNQLVSFLNSL